MAGLSEYKLRLVIDADGRTAEQALNGLYGDVNKLGGGFTRTFGGSLAIFNAAAAGVTAVGAATIGVGIALFDLTKHASDFGSEIFDATQKTGLGAVAISSLKAAADQSGSSLESVTGGIAKFAKGVAAAGEDAKKSAKFVKDFGIEPLDALNDLEGALNKVFKRIYDAKPGVEQMTLAQRAFGKSGAELIPVINATNGDLEAFKKRCEELGITIDDQAASAADAFGDQLDTLNMQIAGVGRTIGTALMPQFTNMAGTISTWIEKNQGEIQDYAARIATLFGTIIRGFDRVKNWIVDNQLYLRIAAGFATLGGSEVGIAGASSFIKLLDQASTPGPKGSVEARGGSGIKATGFEVDNAGGAGTRIKPPKENDAEFRRFFTEAGFAVVRTFGKAINPGSLHPSGLAADISIRGKTEDDIAKLIASALTKGYRLADERKPLPGVKQTGPHLHFERTGSDTPSKFQDESMYGKVPLGYLKDLDLKRRGQLVGGDTAVAEYNKKQAEEKAREQDKWLEKMRAGLRQEADMYAEAGAELAASEQRASDQRLAIRDAEAGLASRILIGQLDNEEFTTREYAERIGQMRIDMLLDEESEVKGLADTEENRNRLSKLGLAIATARLEKEQAIAKAMSDQLDAAAGQLTEFDAFIAAGAGKVDTNKLLGKSGGFSGSFLSGIDDAIGKVRSMSDVMGQLGTTAADAFMQMGQGLGASLQAWTLLGGQADISMGKLVATTLAGVAAQSATLSSFHTAMGIAALTPWGAAIYGPAPLHFKAAALWGGIAIATALGGRAMAGDKFQNKGSSGGGSGYGSSSSGGNNYSSDPYSRSSSTAFDSGQRDSTAALAAEIRFLNAKLVGMSPKDVLAVGAKQSPGFFGRQAMNDLSTGRASGKKFAQSIGLRKG